MQSCNEQDPIKDNETNLLPESPNITIKFDAVWDGSPFRMGRIFTDDFGNRVRADLFKNYISIREK